MPQDGEHTLSYIVKVSKAQIKAQVKVRKTKPQQTK